ncbi:unnamed protein product [Menidia menidia]|uniref:(Atlantic silverside) hypothetical protein n=1 Tax=Menidia menidia TaxID=238744 RepID=A0A8S4C103_9TELE|nr:unnamed protein product [Menidia menidia]
MASSEIPPPSIRQEVRIVPPDGSVSGVVVRDLLVKVSPLSVPSTRIPVSGVPPLIPNIQLESKLRRLGKLASSFQTINLGCKDHKLKHVQSLRRQVFMFLESPTQTLALSFRLIKTEGEAAVRSQRLPHVGVQTLIGGAPRRRTPAQPGNRVHHVWIPARSADRGVRAPAGQIHRCVDGLGWSIRPLLEMSNWRNSNQSWFFSVFLLLAERCGLKAGCSHQLLADLLLQNTSRATENRNTTKARARPTNSSMSAENDFTSPHPDVEKLHSMVLQSDPNMLLHIHTQRLAALCGPGWDLQPLSDQEEPETAAEDT